MNGNAKWLSRSFWLVAMFGVFALGLSVFLKNPVPFTVTVNVGIGGWFTGKAVDAYQKKNGTVE